jgi:TetR/AcrR family transcriptional regulator, fatty acid metabolism regulator protein
MPVDEYKLKFRILKHSEDLFFNYGFSSITMSMIAEGLGIGKATIYKYFDNKESILHEVIDLYFKDINQGIENINVNEKICYLEKVKEYIHFVGDKLLRLQKKHLVDIKKNAPEIWIKIEMMREEIVKNKFIQLFDEGIEKGYLRNDIDKELIMLMIFNLIQKVGDPEVLAKLKYTYSDVFNSLFKIIFEGMLVNTAEVRHFQHDDNKTGNNQISQ